MPRIRSIRPEFFSDPVMANLSPQARLFYMALWCDADDEGRGRYLVRALEGFAFPHEPDVHAQPLMDELEAAGRVVVYEAKGERFYWIPTFNRYQKPNRPRPSTLPPPPNHCTSSDDSVNAHEQDSDASHAGVGEGEGEGVGDNDDVAVRFAKAWTPNWTKPDPSDVEHARKLIDKHPAIGTLSDEHMRAFARFAKAQGARWVSGAAYHFDAWTPPAPDWCGECEQSNRMVSGSDGDLPCPRCHPKTVAVAR